MDKIGCRQRILEKYESEMSTQTERKISRYLRDNFETALHSNLLDLAELIGVSDASIVRFCKGIGYKGFQEFKINAALEFVPEEKLYNPRLDRNDSAEGICNKIFSTEISALTRTLQDLDIEELVKIVNILSNAPRIMFVGTGGSMAVAKDAQHKFLKIGVQVSSFEDKDIQLMEASLLKKHDVLFAVSHSGNNLHVINVAETARENGTTVVALVSQGKNELAKKADYVLSTISEETIFQSESGSTRLAHLAVIDCIVAMMAFKNYDRSLSAMQKTREATSGNKM